MRIFLDTEFIEDGKTIDLISIGLVRADFREYYAECLECDLTRASDWVRQNVLPQLSGDRRPRDVIAREIVAFVGPEPEFWGYYADYDWVALCQLYGTMMDLPKGWPMFCMDIKQAAVSVGNPWLEATPGKDEHNALADARWSKAAWELLRGFSAAGATI